MLTSLLRYETPKKTRSFSNDYITLEKNTKVIKLQDIQGSLEDFEVRARVSQRIHDIPRVMEYCNSPRNPVTGQEGNQAYLSHRGVWWISGRASDSRARSQGFETYLRHVVSLKPQSHIHSFGLGRATVQPDLSNCGASAVFVVAP